MSGTGPPWPRSDTDRARERYAYIADEQLSGEILSTLGRIMSWDHRQGADLRARIAPLRFKVRMPLHGLGTDREPVGFTTADGNPPAALPPGLTGLGDQHGVLVPTLDESGAPWRALLGEASERPSLAGMLDARGVPPVVLCRSGASVHRMRMVPPSAGPEGSVRAATLLWEHCPPMRDGAVPPGTASCAPWEFDLAVELVRSATAARRESA